MGRSLLDPTVVDLVHHEAALLDARRLEEWLELFTADGLLWVPGRAGDVDPTAHVSIIYDHLPQLRARVARLLSGKETAQDPPSRTLRALTNLRLAGEPDPGGEVTVESVQVLYETRSVGGPLLVLPARVTHRLRPAPQGQGPGWGIVSKRIDLLEVERHFDNLAFLL